MSFSAEEWLKSKKLTKASQAQTAQAKAHGFFVAGLERLDLLSDIKTALEEALKEGKPLRDFQKQLVPHLTQKGWLQGQGGAKAIPHRLKIIYETNVRLAYHAGQWARIERRAKLMPYLIYRLGPSHQHRPQHQAWAGVTLKVNHPFWQIAAPPNGFGCKCRVEQVSRKGLEAIKQQGGIKEPSLGNKRIALQEPKTSDEVKRILPAQSDTDNGKVRFRYSGVDDEFVGNPARFQGVRMRQALAAKATGFFGEDFEARDAYLARMTTHITQRKALESFVLDAPKYSHESMAVGFFTQKEKQKDPRLELEKPIELEGLLIVKKTKASRHAMKGDALSLEEWQDLMEVIAKPDHVYYDKQNKTFIYVRELENDDAIKIAIRANHDKNQSWKKKNKKRKRSPVLINSIRTAFRIPMKTMQGMVKGGLWDVIR